MQSVSCSVTLSSQVCCWISVESEHLSSNASEVFRQGRRVFNKSRAAHVLKPSSKSSTKGWGGFSAGPSYLNGQDVLGVGTVSGETSSLEAPPGYLNVLSSLITDPSDTSTAAPAERKVSSEKKVFDVVAKQASMFQEQKQKGMGFDMPPGMDQIVSPQLLTDAYARCGEVCAEYAKTFYLGTKLMTPERQRAIWAIYVWCRRTDELVDGPNASRMTPTALDRWEERLEDIFRGQPYDMLDAALADTVARFPVDIQPFRDMVDGMRMDLVKSRYSNFDELYLYCYNVAGTVGLMSVPVMGIAPESKATTESVYSAALALGIANQLTNILRDVGEDSRRRRIYLPQDELHQFGLSDEDIFAGQVTDRWRAFMKNQIRRARMFFNEAEKGAAELDKDSRWPVWASLILYRGILDAIEANDYNNFTKRAYVGKWKKLLTLPAAYGRALVPPPSTAPRLIRV